MGDPTPTVAERVAWNPALVIGTVTTIISAALAAYTAAQATGLNPVVPVVLAVLPLAGQALTRNRVVSKQWLLDQIDRAQTAIDVVRPIAQEIDAPASTVPTS